MMFRAVKAIAAGAEITIDYGEEHMALYFKDGCRVRRAARPRSTLQGAMRPRTCSCAAAIVLGNRLTQRGRPAL